MDDADRLTPRERYTRRETTRTRRQKNKYARARARTANARALGLLSVAFTLPMTFPLGFFAAEPSRASGENCKYSDFFPSSNGSNPRSPGSEPSSHAGRSPNGNAICVESRAFSSVDPIDDARTRAPLSTRFFRVRTASRSARGAPPLAFFVGAFFAGLFAAGFARDTVFFAGVAVFFTVEVFLVVVVFIASRRVATIAWVRSEWGVDRGS